MATDLLTTIRGEIEARLSELRPALDEYEDLISAEQALGDGGEAASDDDAAASVQGVSSRARYSRPGRRIAARVAAKARSTVTEPGAKPPPAESRPRVSGGRRAAAKPTTAKRGRPATGPKPQAATSPRSARKPRSDETERGILAALEHGSHTAAELVMVTAFTAQSIRRSLTRLERAGTIGRTRRDGQTAYVRA